MSKSNINRDEFFAHLAEKMGRPTQYVPNPMPENAIKLPQTKFTELSIKERCQKFIDIAKELGIAISLIKNDEVESAITSLLEKYPGDVIIHDDKSLTQITNAIVSTGTRVRVWNPDQESDLREYAATCGLGIINAIHGFADGAGIAVESSKLHGRSVSLLPKVSLVQVKTSVILPRIYQYAFDLSQRAQKGERMPSVINIITGPSATADVELIKVIGVHGPVEMAVLLIDDLDLDLTV